MTIGEKTLYHQIHPAKLATDWGFGLLALIPFWQHHLVYGLLITFVPSMIASMVLIRWGNLEGLKHSRFGKYIKRYMTRGVEYLRFLGFAIALVCAWYHQPWEIAVGIAVVLLAWLKGVLLPGKG